jgi:phage terminase small subunit
MIVEEVGVARAGIPEDRLRRFVEVFMTTTNATEAARAAGYTGSSKVASESARKLLKRPDVQKMIEDARAAATKDAIATREERQAWWTRIMRGEPIPVVVKGKKKMAVPPLAERRKASELLGKSQGDFVHRVDVKVHGTVSIELPDNGREPSSDA